MLTTSSKSVPTTRSVALRRVQSAGQADAIAAALHEIETVQRLPELTQRLAAAGFTAAHLAEGVRVQASAQAAFNARQQALAAERLAFAQLKAGFAAANTTYQYFRRQARTVCPEVGDRIALTLTGRTPKDTQKFLTQARTAYAAAGQPEYAGILDAASFGPAPLAAALAELAALQAAYDDAKAAHLRATEATVQRNRALTALDLWMKRFYNVLAVVRRRRAAQGSNGGSAVPVNQAGDSALSPPVEMAMRS